MELLRTALENQPPEVFDRWRSVQSQGSLQRSPQIWAVRLNQIVLTPSTRTSDRAQRERSMAEKDRHRGICKEPLVTPPSPFAKARMTVTSRKRSAQLRLSPLWQGGLRHGIKSGLKKAWLRSRR